MACTGEVRTGFAGLDDLIGLEDSTLRMKSVEAELSSWWVGSPEPPREGGITSRAKAEKAKQEVITRGGYPQLVDQKWSQYGDGLWAPRGKGGRHV